MSKAGMTGKLGAVAARWAALGAMAAGLAGCGTIGDSMTTRDIMTIKQNLDEFSQEQKSENLKIQTSLSQIDSGLKDNNEIAKQSIDDVQKRIHDLMQEVNKLRGQVEALSVGMGRPSSAGSTGFTSTPADPAGAGPADLMPGGGTPAATAPDSGAGAHMTSGLSAYTIGNYDEADKEFQAALAMNPNTDQTTEIEYWLGEIQYNKQDFPKALQHYRKAIETNRSHEKAWASLEKWALIKIQQGQKDSGLEYLKYIVQNNPMYSNIDAVKAKIKELGGGGGAAKGDEAFGLMPTGSGAAKTN